MNGDPARRLPGNLNLSFDGVPGDALVASCPGVALSTGSACASARPEPSPVLLALGLPMDRVREGFRIGLGRGTRESDVDLAADEIAERRRAPAGRARRLAAPGAGG